MAHDQAAKAVATEIEGQPKAQSAHRASEPDSDLSPLFEPFEVRGLKLNNRIVMPAMGRHFNDDGVPSQGYVDYFRRRAAAGTGLLITEVASVEHPVSQANPGYARLHGQDALESYARIVEAVHGAGGRIFPQLVHCGAVRQVGASPNPDLAPLSPSGLYLPFESFGEKPAASQVAEPASIKDIDAAIDGFASSARHAKAIGFDGVQLHGAHGYLIDQFFWDKMNRRQDVYGGSLVDRTRFATEVIRAVRDAVGDDYPVFFRWSQWKQQDYWAKLCQTPAELEDFLTPLSEAGVDVFDCSTRRVWEPEFDCSPLNVAGWTKRITGKPTVTVGSISLDHDPLPSKEQGDRPSEQQLRGRCPPSIAHVVGMLKRGECDLVAVGRAMITNPDWTRDLQDRQWERLGGYSAEALASLY